MEDIKAVSAVDVKQLPLSESDGKRSRYGYLVFDQLRKVVHTSSSLQSVLKLPEENLSFEGEDVLSVVKYVVGRDSETLDTARQWLDDCRTQVTQERVSLLTGEDARTVMADLSPLGRGYWIATFEDVTAGLDSERAKRAGAFEDRLTGIGNRALFETSLDQRFEQIAAQEIEDGFVLFIDLDRFKSVNDTLGHAVGDALLRKVGERLQSTLRDGDILARLGGDEFAVLLAPLSNTNTATACAAEIIELIQRPYLIEGYVINVGSSIGIASAPDDGRTRDDLLKSADLALYHSKAVGRGVFNFFHPAMGERAQQRRLLELELRKALTLRQFELHYQPQINVETGLISGLEGLLRWRHPQRGLLQPEAFLALAEEIGLAAPIGNWVLKTACKEATRWPDFVTVAVNISALQFETGKLQYSVEQALKNAGLSGPRLEIEVTEDILLRDETSVLTTLEGLRSLGVRVSIDNFGTGLASLSQLVNFPFDKIKIDRSLVAVQQHDAKSRAIVRAISALGQSLGICTLAEGVETSEHLAQVRSDGCQSVQGFYYSKAIPSNELTELFSNLSPLDEAARVNPGGEQ